MPTTLSYGFIKPQTGDKGSVFFPDLEADIQQLNDHTHDGTNSSRLTSAAITPVSDTILHGAWVSVGGGNYRQLVTMPASITFNSYSMAFRIASGPSAGHEVHLSVEKVGVSTYYVYINDSTVDLTVLYLV